MILNLLNWIELLVPFFSLLFPQLAKTEFFLIVKSKKGKWKKGIVFLVCKKKSMSFGGGWRRRECFPAKKG